MSRVAAVLLLLACRAAQAQQATGHELGGALSPQVIGALLTAVVTALGGIAAYWLTKKREREAELRREKLEHYKDFVASLSSAIDRGAGKDAQVAFARACNRLMLVAPQTVIDALDAFYDEVADAKAGKIPDLKYKRMSRLFFEIRRDLGISPDDDVATFNVALRAVPADWKV
jgi:hypothetical protein